MRPAAQGVDACGDRLDRGVRGRRFGERETADQGGSGHSKHGADWHEVLLLLTGTGSPEHVRLTRLRSSGGRGHFALPRTPQAPRTYCVRGSRSLVRERDSPEAASG